MTATRERNEVRKHIREINRGQASSGAASEPHTDNSAETRGNKWRDVAFRRVEAVWKKYSRPCREENWRNCDGPSEDAAALTDPTVD